MKRACLVVLLFSLLPLRGFALTLEEERAKHELTLARSPLYPSVDSR